MFAENISCKLGIIKFLFIEIRRLQLALMHFNWLDDLIDADMNTIDYVDHEKSKLWY